MITNEDTINKIKSIPKNLSTASIKKDETNHKINSQTKYIRKNMLPTNETSQSKVESVSLSKKAVVSTSSVKHDIIFKKDYESSSSSVSSTRTPRFKMTENEPNLAAEAEIRYLEHKFIQCNIPRTDQKTEGVLPEQLTSFLLLLTSVQQKKDKSKESTNIRKTIEKILKLLTEMSARPISKIHEFRTDYTKQCQDTSDELNNLIKGHTAGSGTTYEKLLKDIKKVEKHIDEKNERIAALKQKMEENRLSQKIKTSDPLIRLKNSLSEYQTLKAELKFNAGQFKKYKKLLTEKEFAKQKSIHQLEHLKKSAAKMKEKIKAAEETSHITANEEEVFYGGMLTKYVRTKHDKEKSAKLENPTTAKKTTKSIKK